MKRYAIGRSLLTILTACFCFACAAGGTAGTGNIISIEGKILDTSQSPVVGLTITVAETGQKGITDNTGVFNISTEPVSGNVELLVEGTTDQGAVSSSLVVEDIPADTTVVNIQAKLDPQSNLIVIQDLEVRAKIVGTCDSYFENRRIIRQANAAPQGVECTAKVWLSEKGAPLGGLPFTIQVRSCPDDSAWETVVSSETRDFEPSEGIGQVQFNFFDDFEHCVYRIIAPFGDDKFPDTIHEVHTFTKQSFDDNNTQ